MTGNQQRPMGYARAPVIALVLLGLSGGALAAPQPITDLPLRADGEQQWRLPAGQYRGSFSIDQPMSLTCAPDAVFQGQGQGNTLIIRAPNVQVQGCTFLDWGDRKSTRLNSSH